jgi:hypothetical protein
VIAGRCVLNVSLGGGGGCLCRRAGCCFDDGQQLLNVGGATASNIQANVAVGGEEWLHKPGGGGEGCSCCRPVCYPIKRSSCQRGVPLHFQLLTPPLSLAS